MAEGKPGRQITRIVAVLKGVGHPPGVYSEVLHGSSSRHQGLRLHRSTCQRYVPTRAPGTLARPSCPVACWWRVNGPAVVSIPQPLQRYRRAFMPDAVMPRRPAAASLGFFGPTCSVRPVEASAAGPATGANRPTAYPAALPKAAVTTTSPRRSSEASTGRLIGGWRVPRGGEWIGP